MGKKTICLILSVAFVMALIVTPYAYGASSGGGRAGFAELGAEIFDSDGERVNDPSALGAGEYTVCAYLDDYYNGRYYYYDNDCYNADIYVALKADGKLYSVEKETVTVSDDSDWSAEAELTLTVGDIEADKLGIEVYCWDDEYTPIAEKYTFELKNDVVFNGKQFYDGYYDYDGYIDYYENEDSVQYSECLLSRDANIYVNDVLCSRGFDYIVQSESCVVTLTDTVAGYGYDGYENVYIRRRYDAVVKSVEQNGSEYIINWAASDPRIGTLTVDTDDDGVSVNIIKNGEEADITQINPRDVVSIEYDVTGSFENSSFYNLYVSDSKVSGRVKTVIPDGYDVYNYYINGVGYPASTIYMDDIYYSSGSIIRVGKEYILYLNAFGEFVWYDEDISGIPLGIVDYANVDSTDTPRIRIITTEGTKVSYNVKDNSKNIFQRIASRFFDNAYNTSAGTACTGKKSLENILCTYSVNSAGYLTDATPIHDTIVFSEMEYREENNKLGGFKIAADAKIIDLSDSANDVWNQVYTKVRALSVDGLRDGAVCTGVAAMKNGWDEYEFIVMTSYLEDKSMAPIYVYSDTVSEYDEEMGAAVDVIRAYGPDSGSLVNIKVDSTCDYIKEYNAQGERGGGISTSYASAYHNLSKGTMFIYEADSDGYAIEVKKLFEGVDNSQKYFFNDAFKVGYNTSVTPVEPLLTDNIYPPGAWLNTTEYGSHGEVSMIFGPVMDKRDSYVSVGRVFEEDGHYCVDTEGTYEMEISPDANIYIYDYSYKLSKRLSKGTYDDIRISFSVPVGDGTSGVRELADRYGIIDFVSCIAAKTVNGVITDALVILSQ